MKHIKYDEVKTLVEHNINVLLVGVAGMFYLDIYPVNGYNRKNKG